MTRRQSTLQRLYFKNKDSRLARSHTHSSAYYPCGDLPMTWCWNLNLTPTLPSVTKRKYLSPLVKKKRQFFTRGPAKCPHCMIFLSLCETIRAKHIYTHTFILSFCISRAILTAEIQKKCFKFMVSEQSRKKRKAHTPLFFFCCITVTSDSLEVINHLIMYPQI